MSGVQVTATVKCDGKGCGHQETVTVRIMAHVRHVLKRRGWDVNTTKRDYCPDCALKR